jgi:hypothetical protein
VSLAVPDVNGKGPRPQAVFVGVTTGGRHARPPMAALDGKGR